jgi:signal transduction histidine kinase
MKRPVLTWLMFGICAVIVVAALAWMTRIAVRLDQAEAEATRQAALQESIRLALWRMDSALAPLIAQENARPYFHYSAYYPAERAYGRMFTAVMPGEVLLPSPLLTAPVPGVLLYFQASPGGNLSSPQVPAGEFRRIAVRAGVDERALGLASERLAEAERIPRQALLGQFGGGPPDRPGTLTRFPPGIEKGAPPAPVAEQQKQKVMNDKEYAARASQQIALNRDMALQNAVAANKTVLETTAQTSRAADKPAIEPSIVGDAPMQASWQGEALILARRVWVDRAQYVQGCWLDWAALRVSLLGSVHDLLPHAELMPLRADGDAPPGLRLAALPVALIPGAVNSSNGRPASLLRTSLPVVWAAVLAAVLAAGILLHKSVALSERRAAFVSAVTHELRTPLTTFRLYTEMLDEGMAPAAADQKDFLHTLRREAERLDHLVRNVLAYARLEKNRTTATMEDVPVEDLFGRTKDRLIARAGEAGFAVDIHTAPELGRCRIRTDASAVEQILFNLVDNAAKYAGGGDDRRIDIAAGLNGRDLQISVRDYGPGLSASARKRLFRPFSKSAVEAARSAPGVGLGLALSRRLARSLGGDLSHDPRVTPGACFVLRLRPTTLASGDPR